ncbi:hypothetical protein MMC25_004514 [Agyrium rufum]|nr:hypothetical protein [Agyrium rufum]
MWNYVLSLLTAGICYAAWSIYQAFSKNLAAAKASGVPYIITPIYPFSLLAILTTRKALRRFKKLPRFLAPNVELSTPQWTWSMQFTKYKELGTDTFLTVSPGGNILWTVDPETISQITMRRNDFPKPDFMYRSIKVYGNNVITAEGQAWRQHRKITSPPFSEKNNHLVWAESIRQTQAMLKSWTLSGEKTVTTLPTDSKRLSLHVISKAGFGVSLLWPGVDTPALPSSFDETSANGESGQADDLTLRPGHKMTYTDAISMFIEHLFPIMLVPKELLKRIPMQYFQDSYVSFVEWTKYMHEMLEMKKQNIIAGNKHQGPDLLGALIRGAGYDTDMLKSATDDKATPRPQTGLITDDEIISNSFVFIVAGHETTANSIHFCLNLLAMSPHIQRRLQEDLADIFQGRPSSEWDYDRDLPRLFNGMAAAVMNEQLRLLPPVINIPKCVPEGETQHLTLSDGKQITIAGGTLIQLNANNVHRNPKYWPVRPPSDPQNPYHHTSNLDNDLEEFQPERWFVDPTTLPSSSPTRASMPKQAAATAAADKSSSETDDLGINTAADTASSFLRPIKGAYIPFSEGYRSCLGRRFAQVEVLVVLALIFTQFSVELAVDEFASDAEVEGMSDKEEERREVWGKAHARAKELMSSGMRSKLTLQMDGGVVPLRVVRRGEERFAF